MQIAFTDAGWDDYLYWSSQSATLLNKINALIEDIRRSPFRGIGKPEPLRGDYQGWWSRRITGEHRLIYRITGSGQSQQVQIAQCRYHY